MPQDQLYWDKDEFIGNTGIKKTFSVNRFHKLLEYLHISDRALEAQRNDPNYDKLGKIHPMLEIIQQRFLEHYMPGKEQTIDEGMIAYKGRLSFMQYMPAKPIKHGIKVWMRCDSKSAYLQQFNIYLGCGGNSEYGMGYDVVMNLCEQIRGKNYHVYFDNLFTSVPLLNELLQHNIYACRTVRMNKQYIPDSVKKPGKMV